MNEDKKICCNCKNDINKDIVAGLPYSMVAYRKDGQIMHHFGCYRCFKNCMEMIGYVRNKKKI